MDGIINVYKEAGFTSHDVVAKLRGICRQKDRGTQVHWIHRLPVCFLYVLGMLPEHVKC